MSRLDWSRELCSPNAIDGVGHSRQAKVRPHVKTRRSRGPLTLGAWAVGALTLACSLSACTASDYAQRSVPSIIDKIEIQAPSEAKPDPDETRAHAVINASLNGRPLDIIRFSSVCVRSHDGDRLTISSETKGYGYRDYNLGIGVGAFDIEIVGLNSGRPTVNAASINSRTGPNTVDSVYVSGPNNDEPQTGVATVTAPSAGAYLVSGSGGAGLRQSSTFTAHAKCDQPPPQN